MPEQPHQTRGGKTIRHAICLAAMFAWMPATGCKKNANPAKNGPVSPVTANQRLYDATPDPTNADPATPDPAAPEPVAPEPAALGSSPLDPPRAKPSAQAEQFVRRLAKVKSYEGGIVERGLLPQGEKIESKILYKWPNTFRVSVVAPDYMDGVSVGYTGKTLLYVFPQLRTAVRIRNLELPDGDEAKKLMATGYDRSQKVYSYTLGSGKRVAGLATFTLSQRARGKANPLRKGWHRVYEKYAFPLAGKLSFRDGSTYSYEFDSIRFNVDVPDERFSLSVPREFLVANWDLAGKSYSLEEARKEASFDLAFPESPLGMSLRRIVRIAGPLPAFTAVYERGSFVALISAFQGGSSLPAYGIPVKTSKSGRLLITPILSSFSFVHDGTTYILFGNLPFEDLLAIGDLVGE